MSLEMIQDKFSLSIIFFCVTILMLMACSGGSSGNAGLNEPEIGYVMVFPGSDWEMRTPESQGVDSAKLNKAMSYLDANAGGVGASEAVVIRNGYMIWKGSNIDNYHIIYSATKTFTTTILGILVKEGKISLDDYAVKYLPGLDDIYTQYSNITIRQLASMTSGYDGINGDCWGLYEAGKMAEYDACVPTYLTPGTPLFNPGTAFKCHDPAVHLLGHILTKVAGKSLKSVFQEKIAGPIGITRWEWSDYGTKNYGSLGDILFNNPAGTHGGVPLYGQGGISITARDFARYGLLYLNRGNWNGKQLIDASWVDQATTNQASTSLSTLSPPGYDRRGRFGFMWWPNGITISGKRPWPSAPPKTYTSNGGARNFCFVIPEWNMVIVRMEKSVRMSDYDKIWDNLFKILKEGISEPANPAHLQ